jgi:hypothetical protein
MTTVRSFGGAPRLSLQDYSNKEPRFLRGRLSRRRREEGRAIGKGGRSRGRGAYHAKPGLFSTTKWKGPIQTQQLDYGDLPESLFCRNGSLSRLLETHDGSGWKRKRATAAAEAGVASEQPRSCHRAASVLATAAYTAEQTTPCQFHPENRKALARLPNRQQPKPKKNPPPPPPIWREQWRLSTWRLLFKLS